MTTTSPGGRSGAAQVPARADQHLGAGEPGQPLVHHPGSPGGAHPQDQTGCHWRTTAVRRRASADPIGTGHGGNRSAVWPGRATRSPAQSAIRPPAVAGASAGHDQASFSGRGQQFYCVFWRRGPTRPERKRCQGAPPVLPRPQQPERRAGWSGPPAGPQRRFYRPSPPPHPARPEERGGRTEQMVP